MEQKVYEEEEEIDLLELLMQLLNNWFMIVVATVLAAAIAFSLSKFVITPEYESVSELYVLTKSTSITSLTDLQMGTNLTNDYLVVVTGRPVLEQVIDNLGLDMDYATMEGKITVENPSDSRILEIHVTDPDPEMAKSIADEVADVSAKFISEKMDQDPPTVIQYGYSDGDAVSPNTMKNTAIGGVLGFALACAIVIFTYLLDDSIMNAEDIEKKLGANMLGSLPLVEEEYDGGKSDNKKNVKKKKSA